jgi:hypothetical protein
MAKVSIREKVMRVTHRRRRSKELQILNPLSAENAQTDKIEKIANTC